MLREYGVKHIVLDNGERLAYREVGHGDNVLLLVHGNMASSLYFIPVLERVPKGFRAVAIDLRGFGESSYIKEIQSFKDMSEDLFNVVCKLNLKDFIMVGWSAGGGVCMQFEADHPGYAKKMVLIASIPHFGIPFCRWDEKGRMIPDSFFKSKAELADDPMTAGNALMALKNKDADAIRLIWDRGTYTNKKPEPEYYEVYLNEALKHRSLLDVDWAMANFNISDEHNGYVQGDGAISKINIPVLCIRGDMDIAIPDFWVKSTVKALGKKAVLKVFNKCGHSPIVDCPDMLVDEIAGFAGST
ncbi:MAG: alpha/beta fold hydrolase [Bacillota bacterium]